MAESAFAGRSRNFAIEMLREALHIEGIREIWVNHDMEPLDGDMPQQDRHLVIRVNLDHYMSIVAECWVHQEHGRWNRGEVKFHQVQDCKPINERQKMYFRYAHAERGMEFITATTVMVRGNTAWIEGEQDKLRAFGPTPLAALGELVRNNHERFGIAIDFAE